MGQMQMTDVATMTTVFKINDHLPIATVKLPISVCDSAEQVYRPPGSFAAARFPRQLKQSMPRAESVWPNKALVYRSHTHSGAQGTTAANGYRQIPARVSGAK